MLGVCEGTHTFSRIVFVRFDNILEFYPGVLRCGRFSTASSIYRSLGRSAVRRSVGRAIGRSIYRSLGRSAVG